jgi:3-(3-hydroxy-phenyl)propionate hydroxylase
MDDDAAHTDVAVIGGGPVGMTVAALLAAHHVRVQVLERNHSTSHEPKAISIDDEALRVYQSAGMAERLLRIIVPGTGTRYYDRVGRPLFQARTGQPRRHGYPFKNPFTQPDLERELAQHLRGQPTVSLRMGTEVTSLSQDADGVLVRSTGGPVRARYVLACDGGGSRMREQLRISMTGRSYPDVWLVVDVLGDKHDERYGMHHGDPARPRVVIPGRNGRCRYEFQLHPGEGESGVPPDFRLVRRLLAPYRDIAEDQIERAVTYRFHALVADRWRCGNVFLLGDAAHMMPPFAAQGLNSGIRDAANLAWKIADVLGDRLTDAALDSYEKERKPHVAATVALSERMRRVVMTTNPQFAARRDEYLRRVLSIEQGRDFLEHMRYRPPHVYSAGLLVDSQAPVGTMIGQPEVFDAMSGRIQVLDKLLGPGWALLGVGVDPGQLISEAHHVAVLHPTLLQVAAGDRLPAPSAEGTTAIVDLDGRLDADLAPYQQCCVLLRPDRFIAAAWTPGSSPELTSALCISAPGVVRAVQVGHHNTDRQTAAPRRPSFTAGSDEADYIIVGAGVAGPVVATRLATRTDAQVVLLEAGEPLVQRESLVPALWPQTLGSAIDWQYRTIAQPALGGRTLAWPRGKVLGGSAALNLGGWIRGTSADYDAWAEYGGPEWSWETMLPLYRRAEDSGRGRAPWRGCGGPVRLQEARPGAALYRAVEAAIAEAGYGGRTDANGPQPFGSDTKEMTFVDGIRITPAAGYLGMAGGRRNLRVRTGVFVESIVFDGDRAVGVIVRTDNGPRVIRARREVILTAGAIGTPHLLLRSGIGPADHLRRFGLAVRSDLPGVGANLHDHLQVPFSAVATPDLVDLPAAVPTPENLHQWETAREGPLRDLAGTGVAFLRTDPALTVPDVELLIATGQGRGGDPDRAGYRLAPVLLQPRSRGTLRLASTDPAAAPVLDPGYLTDPADLATLIAGLRAALRISRQPALRSWTAKRSLDPGATDAELAVYIRASADTVFHPVGTARLGRDDDPFAVVDAQLRVRGIEGLRIADLSVVPVITRGHTMAPAVVVAERAADLIHPPAADPRSPAHADRSADHS